MRDVADPGVAAHLVDSSASQHLGKYTTTQAAITAIAYVLMIVGQVIPSGIGKNIGDISRFYDSITVPPGAAFGIWGIIFLLQAVYIILNFVWRGDDTSGRNGQPDDLASMNYAVQWPLRFAFICQGAWSMLYKFVRNDYPPLPNSGKIGAARGSALQSFDFYFWFCSILIFITVGAWYVVVWRIHRAVKRNEWTAGSRQILIAYCGIFMNAGWITVAANIMPSSMVMVITKIGDGGNVGMQIAALTSAFIVAIVVFLPMFSRKTKKANFVPMYFAVCWAFAWLSRRLWSHTNIDPQFEAMLVNTYTTKSFLSEHAFVAVYRWVALILCCVSFIFGGYGIIEAVRS